MKNPYHLDLTGTVAVVTGGSGILGTIWVRALVSCGASVAILGRDLAKAENLAAELRSHGGKVLALSVDVKDPVALEASALVVDGELGPCSLLVNAAGGNHPQGGTSMERYGEPGGSSPISFFDLSPEGARHVFDLNFLGTLYACQVFAKRMIGRSGCSIINISSASSHRPLTKVALYASAKAAVNNFTQWLAVHFAPAGIRVNAIAPGFFLTEQNRTLMTNPDGSPTPRAKKVLAQTPFGRFGEPEELAGVLLWLADVKASSFVTGAVIPVDGGFGAYAGV